MTRHPAFVAEVNRRRYDRATENGIKIASVTAAALNLVEEAVAAGDLAVAIRWLLRFGPGLFVSDERFPMSAEEVIEERRLALPIGADMSLSCCICGWVGGVLTWLHPVCF